MKKLHINIQYHTVAGIKAENQDACGFHVPEGALLTSKGIMAVVADGVSSCDKAREASACCVKGLLSDYYSTPDSWSTEHAASKVISALNNWLHSQSVRDGASMLSTLSVLILKGNTAHVFHVGDSRVYLLRDQNLAQLTQDHVRPMQQKKAYLSRAIGFDLKVDVDYYTYPIQMGDVFLLSSDGVHDFMNRSAIQNQLTQTLDAEALVDRALHEGKSQDNIAAVVCEVAELEGQNFSEALEELTHRPIPPDLEPGMKLNGFEVKKLIHASVQTQLYLAVDTKTKQQVVLKTPSVNFEDDPQYLQHFSYEEWVGQRIQNPHVVKVHPSPSESAFLAYALEYIKGKTLRQWIQENPEPDLEVVVSIVKQIIKGLRAFHRLEMLHCDLKPENIMIDTIGQVKLIDFGATRVAGALESMGPITIHDNQGTLGYTAPEIILGEKASQFSDQFSLGVMVYEMLVGTLPYDEAMDKNLTAKKLAKTKYKSLLTHNPHLPIWVDGAVHRACHRVTESRYQSLSEFLFDLQNPNKEYLMPVKWAEKTNALSSVVGQRFLLAASLLLNLILLLMLIR